jgi:hypothetical protein
MLQWCSWRLLKLLWDRAQESVCNFRPLPRPGTSPDLISVIHFQLSLPKMLWWVSFHKSSDLNRSRICDLYRSERWISDIFHHFLPGNSCEIRRSERMCDEMTKYSGKKIWTGWMTCWAIFCIVQFSTNDFRFGTDMSTIIWVWFLGWVGLH